MAVVQRTGAGSKPHIFCVVSKPDSNHWSRYYSHRTLGLTPAGNICRTIHLLGYYPYHRYREPTMPLHRAHGIFSAFDSGNSRVKRVKAQNVGEGVSRTSALRSNSRCQGAVPLFIQG